MEGKLYLGCFGLIKPEVDLISTILRNSSRLEGDWILVDSGQCDALLIYNAEKSFPPFILKPNTQLIMIKRRGESYSAHAFFKPFRADELVDTLILIKTNLEAAPVNRDERSVSQQLYSLKKWPSKDLLAKNKHFMLLAVYLSRGAKTIDNLITLSGQNEEFCHQFIKILQEQGLVKEEIKTHQPPRATMTIQVESKKTFLSLLKSRLGIGQA
ncbi:MAG: hypothetical protein V4660_16325 [Pseudomonadota bacterium]